MRLKTRNNLLEAASIKELFRLLAALDVDFSRLPLRINRISDVNLSLVFPLRGN